MLFIFNPSSGTYVLQNYKSCPGLNVDVFKFKPGIADEYKRSTLIVSHCGTPTPKSANLFSKGAGTVLECLRLKKALLCVVNDSMMDNHQVEMMEPLRDDKYIFGLYSPKEITGEEVSLRKRFQTWSRSEKL